MNLFRGMINDNTKYKDLDYHFVNKEKIKNNKIVPNNIIRSNNSRYLNWIEVNKELYYYKMFDMNDFIGVELCNAINLKSVEYDLAMIKGYFQTISKSFINVNKKYYNLKNITSNYKNGISYSYMNLNFFINFLRENNFLDKDINELIDQLLKMAAVDYYMKQRDRLYNNYMFEVNNNHISLAPLYDYGESFSFSDGDYLGSSYLLNIEYCYDNELVPINIYVFNFLIKQYPQLCEYLNNLSKIDLLKIIKNICDKYNLLLSNDLEEKYRSEEKAAKKRIKALLK